MPFVRHGRIGRGLSSASGRPAALKATIDALTSPKRRIEASPGTNGISKGSTFNRPSWKNCAMLQTGTRSLQQIKRIAAGISAEIHVVFLKALSSSQMAITASIAAAIVLAALWYVWPLALRSSCRVIA